MLTKGVSFYDDLIYLFTEKNNNILLLKPLSRLVVEGVIPNFKDTRIGIHSHPKSNPEF